MLDSGRLVEYQQQMQNRFGRNAYIHDNFHEYHHQYVFFYQLPNSNLFTHSMLCFKREASSENYGPRFYFYHITKIKNILLQFIIVYFVLQFIYLPLLDLIPANEFKGIDNPLARVGCKYLLLCVQVLFTRLGVILLLVQ